MTTWSRKYLAIIYLPLAAIFAAGCSPATLKSGAQQSEVTAKEDTTVSDADVKAAAKQVIEALQASSNGDIRSLASLVSKNGLHVFPPFACEPNLLMRNSMDEKLLMTTFTIANCHEDDLSKRPEAVWSEFFESVGYSKALTKTDRIVLNEPHGVGFNTGSSTLAEQQFSAEKHQLVTFFFLGTSTAENRDWDEVGFVFDSSTKPLSLLAIYHDYFSST